MRLGWTTVTSARPPRNVSVRCAVSRMDQAHDQHLEPGIVNPDPTRHGHDRGDDDVVIVAREESAAADRGKQSQQRAVYLTSPDVRTFW